MTYNFITCLNKAQLISVNYSSTRFLFKVLSFVKYIHQSIILRPINPKFNVSIIETNQVEYITYLMIEHKFLPAKT